MSNQKVFNDYLSKQADVRSLSEALVIDSSGRVLARSRFSQSLEFELVPAKILQQASGGAVSVIMTADDNRVRAVVRLSSFADAYLLVGRFVDPKILDHIEKTRGAVAKYQNLEKKQGSIQITFVMVYGLVAMMLLMVATWIGMTLAERMSRPISSLISASERVRGGDLSVRVDETDGTDEIGNLGRSFNRMTAQLQSQQQVLVEANRMLDERRRFTETVLTGVSAGVIGLDSEGRIHLPNRSASDLLGRDLDGASTRKLADVVPEMGDLLQRVMGRPDRAQQDEIQITRDGKFHTLHVSIAAEKLEGDILGYVVTFDDVTDLLTAQRTAAWADVARRIAHEIKNPLTPIQLSAERLKRKFLGMIEDDAEIFSALTDTIVRQVEDIGRMVDEFSSFARMPLATLKNENLGDICQQSVMLERNRQPAIDYQLMVPDDAMMARCDRRQIGQALTNLLKNAAESIIERGARSTAKQDGKICCTVAMETDRDGELRVAVIVEDNGKGLPQEARNRLMEPYVTTRNGGTGLGLAIVRKIMEDHNGELTLEDRAQGGVRARLTFPAGLDAGQDQLVVGGIAHGA
ncbi:MAG TPA: HAMP domain-containing protein [Rhodospirillales bacterium]|nr:HAMP domain-containing protein [Rhodospirillales bacterium]